MKYLLVLLCCIMLGGCAASMTTAEDVEKKSTVSEDTYKKERWIYGPEYPERDPFSASMEKSRLRALIKDGKVAFYQLYHDHHSRDWYFLDSATDSSGKALNFLKIDSTVGYGGVTHETVAVTFSRQYLDAAAAGTGLDIKIDGKRYFVVVKMPPFYVQGFLKKVDTLGK